MEIKPRKACKILLLQQASTLLPPTVQLTPSHLKSKLLEQRFQRWVPQGYRWEEFFYPLAVPPLAETDLDSQQVSIAQAWHPTQHPSLTSAPQALRTSTYSAGPAGRWVAAHERGTWQHGSAPGGLLWQGTRG